MKILVAGFGLVAQSIIRSLLERHGLTAADILCFTYASEDNAPLVKFLEERGIAADFTRLDDKAAFPAAAAFAPDYIASLYYRHIIPASILSLARFKTFNIHPALLPMNRGCFSGPWAIIGGDKETGITYHEMIEKVDKGAILWQKRISITQDDTGYSLYHRLAAESVREFDPFFSRLVNGEIVPREMPSGGSWYPRKVPHQGRIDPAWSDERIDCFIRGMFYPPFKGAIASIGGRDVEINSLAEYRERIAAAKPSLESAGRPS